MTQSYLPGRAVSSPTVESVFNIPPLDGEKQAKGEHVQEAYLEQKERLVNALDSTKTILGDIRKFNKTDWIFRYPQFKDQDVTSPQTPFSPPMKRSQSLRRSLSFADDPAAETSVFISVPKHGMKRSMTLASIADIQEETAGGESLEEDRLLPASEFQILRLDLKLGASRTSSMAAPLVSQLEKASIANLLDERIGSSINHIDKLCLRVNDTSSKVLVTGDLNAGKSTFVNALLRREVMPVDQQPCTTAFCEVHDAAENDGKEEVHILATGVNYDAKDESTFTRGSLEDLDKIVADHEENQPLVKVYLTDSSESLLNNGVVDISLIDAPGLNRDSMKTTALFARQEEIDVVVFVVSAENHFTLSAKEFLLNASNEKAYLFIVVNKYDQIKNKEKCRRIILDQINTLSPHTYKDSEDLVHFVDSAAALQPYAANPAFDDLESALRSFVLDKRSKSKLQPAKTYLNNLLSDVELLAAANAIVANAELELAQDNLAHARPVLEKMKANREALDEDLENVEEGGTSTVVSNAKLCLEEALDRVGRGELGVDKAPVPMPSFPGFMAIFDYARDVRRALVSSLDAAVKLAEDEARAVTSKGVQNVKDMGEVYLPEGVERSRRVFMPEAMFSVRRRGARGVKDGKRGAVVAGGLHGLGIGLASRPEMLDTTISDLFDLHHQLWVHFGDETKEHKDEHALPSALSFFGFGLGAITMVGGQAIGLRSLVESLIRVTDLIGNETARKWAAPVLGAFTIGATAYLVMELPSTIPRTVGRRVKASVVAGRSEQEDEATWVGANAGRIGRETRKVLRLASWDLRERFRTAMDERGREVKGAEERERRAIKAKQWFEEVGERTGTIREVGQLTV